MKILILGSGEVGSTIAKNLVSQSGKNSVTVIDIDDNSLNALSDTLDVQTMLGNASSPSVLAEAGAADTDLMLALTRNDDTNLIACVLGKQIFNIPNRIARIRYSDITEYSIENNAEAEKPQTALSIFDVNNYICPEQLVTDQIIELFRYNNALQVLNFVNGTVQMVVTRANKDSVAVGKKLGELKNDFTELMNRCNIFAIYRNDSLIIPTEQTKIIHGDEICFIALKKDIPEVLKLFHPEFQAATRVIIAGGGNIGYRLAQKAEKEFSVKIIEVNKRRSEWLSENLSSTLVLLGSSTDEKLLEQERIGETDVFCALTNDDEDNIMSGLLAKNYGAKRVISIVNRSSYVDLLQGNTIDIVISPHLTTIGSILAHIRKGDIISVYPLRRGEAEIIEAVIHGTRKTSKIVGRPFSQVKWPHGCDVAAVIRENNFVNINQETTLQENDHVIFFVSRRKVVHELEKILQVKLGFFI